jgi:hypothetical protein
MAMPPQQERGTNVMSILSLVFAFVFAPLGIVFGHIAKKQIRRTGEGRQRPRHRRAGARLHLRRPVDPVRHLHHRRPGLDLVSNTNNV